MMIGWCRPNSLESCMMFELRRLAPLAVVLALAYPFALRTGLTTAPLRVVAEHLAAAT